MMRNNKKSSVRPFLLRDCASTSCARPSIGINRFWLDGLVGFFVFYLGKAVFVYTKKLKIIIMHITYSSKNGGKTVLFIDVFSEFCYCSSHKSLSDRKFFFLGCT